MKVHWWTTRWLLTSIWNERLLIALLWEPRDLWLGLYWRLGNDGHLLNLYICLVPCLPIHIRVPLR